MSLSPQEKNILHELDQQLQRDESIVFKTKLKSLVVIFCIFLTALVLEVTSIILQQTWLGVLVFCGTVLILNILVLKKRSQNKS